MKKYVLTGILTGLALILSQCVIFNAISSVSDSFGSASESLGSVSNSLESISGSFNSSSESSSADEKEDQSRYKAYQNDVREVTYLFLQSNRNDQGLESEIARIALHHGISMWESQKVTWIAIGLGLQDAGMQAADFNKLQSALHPQAARYMSLGYQS